MDMNELIQTNPIQVQRSVRTEELRCITSCQPGKIIPLAYIPLLREDSVSRGELNISFNMAETLHPLLNAVNCKVMVHFVSFLAFERFDGFDSFNRSYQGVVEPGTSTAIPFFATTPFVKAAAFWKCLGVQWPEGTLINTAPLEAYNTLVNFRRRARTDKLPERLMTDVTLAEAFWKNSVARPIVPDWDQAALDGEVPLSFATSRARVLGIGAASSVTATLTTTTVKESGGTAASYARHFDGELTGGMRMLALANGYPDVYAELKDAGIIMSLANIELAKQTAAFAKLRENFDGIDDDHIIDLLMEGIRVPDEALKQPILLDSKSTIFGMQERHAMDGASLDVSLTTGQTSVSVRFRTPPMNTGGIILVTAEVVPEQLYERQRDLFLGLAGASPAVPNFLSDYLDPEKVEVVLNNHMDVHHGQPTAVFGYAPLNWRWKRRFTRAGGKFYRPNPDTFVEDRMRFWSVDTVNPTLASDFYMVTDLANKVFADTVSDPFEVVTVGNVAIVGNTVFGAELEEDAGAYEDVMSQVDTGRIVQVPIPPALLDVEGE